MHKLLLFFFSRPPPHIVIKFRTRFCITVEMFSTNTQYFQVGQGWYANDLDVHVGVNLIESALSSV